MVVAIISHVWVSLPVGVAWLHRVPQLVELVFKRGNFALQVTDAIGGIYLQLMDSVLQIYVHLVHLLHLGDESLKDLLIDGDRWRGEVLVSIRNKLIHLFEVFSLLKFSSLLFLSLLILLDHSWGLWVRSTLIAACPSRSTACELAKTKVINHLIRSSCPIIRGLHISHALFIWCEVIFSRKLIHSFKVYSFLVINIWCWHKRFFRNQLILILDVQDSRALSLFLNWADSIIYFYLSRWVFVIFVIIVLKIFVLWNSRRSA